MSLSTEIQRLHDAKDSIRSAITRRGVQVPSLAKLDDYAEYIDLITVSGGIPIPANVELMSLDDYGRASGALIFNDSLTTISEAFNSCTSLTSVSMPNVTSIGAHVLRNCTSLTSVSMPNVTSIGEFAFSDCTSLTSVSMPNVTSIGEHALGYCTSLTSIDIPSSITSIGANVLRNCTSLTSVICRATTPPSLGNYSFQYGSDELVIYVPAESVDAYKNANRWDMFSSRITAIQE